MENDSKELFQIGVLYTWGFAKYGQIGSFDYQYVAEPLEIRPDSNKEEEKNSQEEIESIHCGEFHSGYITKEKNVYMFGKNTFGQLGLSNNFSICKPQKISLDKKIIKLNLGGEHTLALTESNELYSWGLNVYGQLGLGDFNERTYPHKVFAFDNLENLNKNSNDFIPEIIVDIAAGAQHSLILTESNDLYSCGYGKNYALGDFSHNENSYSLEDRNIFTKIENCNFENIKNKIQWY